MVKARQDHLGFALRTDKVHDNIFVPRYYDPEIKARLKDLSKTHDTISIGGLKKDGYLSAETGHEIGKMAYGTGDVPFIRTSDIVNWEIKADPKQGVSLDIYSEFAPKQDVREGDIFFVRDGTYLIGQACLISKQDLPCLYQSHILKFRIKDNAPIRSALLLACLNTPIVRKQIRAVQFTADIIDTVGNRYLELTLPVPKDKAFCARITKEVDANIHKRAELRDLIKKIPLWIEGHIHSLDDPVPEDWIWRIESTGNPGFAYAMSKVRQNIFIPRYYDPEIGASLKKLSLTHELPSLLDLVKQKVISWETGIEIGKMAYGTGPVPFVRTSDISNWELSSDPKQNISEDIYEANKQDLRPNDIFVVRDGTYLVGTSCILTENDTNILYCGGIYRIRVIDQEKLDPYLLLALFNSPIVRRQMRAKQFTRDIIDTLGKRLFEVILPIPKDAERSKRIAEKTREVVEARVQLRNRAKQIALEVEGITDLLGSGLEDLAPL